MLVLFYNGAVMKIIVVGCGSIGRRHISNLVSLGCEVIGVDLNEEYRNWVESNLKVKTHPDFLNAINSEKPDACWICTPPNTHIPLAKVAIENGLHVFVEKPISDSPADIPALIKKADNLSLKVSVGYNLRFNGGLMKLKELLDSGRIGKPLYARILVGQYLPDWRPWQNYKNSYTAKKSMGGGIILDASHEIDYSRWFFGDAVKITCVAKKLSSLEVETEDNADIIIEFKSGVIANLHLDFIRRDYKRGCEIVGEKGSLDFVFGDSITLYDAETREKTTINVEEPPNEMYLRESKHFLNCISTRKPPLVGAEDGLRTLEIALTAKESAEKQKTIKVISSRKKM